MKGIFKKLFLGLFFCALICAGFSKNVQAAGSLAPDSVIIQPHGTPIDRIEAKASYSSCSDSDTIELEIEFGGAHFDTVTLTYSSSSSSWSVTNSSESYDYKCTTGTSDVTIVTDSGSVDATLAAIRDKAEELGGTNDTYEVELKVISVVGSGTPKTGDAKVKLYNPKATITWNLDGTESDYFKTEVSRLGSFSPGENNWLFEGETYSAKLSRKSTSVPDYLASTVKANLTFNGAAETITGSAITKTGIAYNVEAKFKYDYIKFQSASTDTPLDGTGGNKALAAGKNVTAHYTGSSDEGTFPGTLWKYPDVSVTTDAEGSEFSITDNSDGSYKISSNKNLEGSYTYKIIAKNAFGLNPTSSVDTKYDYVQEYTVKVCKPVESIDWVSKPTKVSLGGTVRATVKATGNGGSLLGELSSVTSSNSTAIPAAKGGLDVTISTTSSASEGNTSNIKAYYKNSDWLAGITPGGSGDEVSTPAATVTITKKATLKIIDKPVGVTVGHTVNLGDFLDNNTKNATIDVVTDGTYAKVSSGASSQSNVLGSKATVYGRTVGKEKGEVYIYNAGTTDPEDYADSAYVTVYPEPSISAVGGDYGGLMSFNASGGSSSSANAAGITITVPTSTYHGSSSEWLEDVNGAYVTLQSRNKGAITYTTVAASGSSNNSSNNSSALSKTATISLSALTNNAFRSIASGDTDQILVTAYPYNSSSDEFDDELPATTMLTIYKISFNGDRATYKVNGNTVSDYFYAIPGVSYKIESAAKNSGEKFEKWEGGEASTATIDSISFSGPKTLKAIYSGSSSSSSSASSSTAKTAAGGGSSSSPSGEGLDDVPKTGESKADIWILWTVLLVSILGAGFMIYRRFGVVNAIAKADAEEAVAIEEEKKVAETKEKEDTLRILKDLRDLK